MSLKGIAKQTLQIIERGRYTTKSGGSVDISDALEASIAGTRTYSPAELSALVQSPDTQGSGRPRIDVTPETTQVAARRLVIDEGCADLVLLAFASARNVGGGFIKGARAQEEDLYRSSGLYAALSTQPTYYKANRAQSSLLYTDHIIYTPRMPFFRVHNRRLLEVPFEASVITAPAPNAGEVLRRDPSARPQIVEALRRRAAMVLAIARDQGHRTLLLGAWGCGVFRNDPAEVAHAFAEPLAGPRFGGCFERVVFAVLDKTSDRRTIGAFERTLGASAE